jgi:hypothetical protein
MKYRIEYRDRLSQHVNGIWNLLNTFTLHPSFSLSLLSIHCSCQSTCIDYAIEQLGRQREEKKYSTSTNSYPTPLVSC